MGVCKGETYFFFLGKGKKVSFFLHPVIFSPSDSGWHYYCYTVTIQYICFYYLSFLRVKNRSSMRVGIFVCLNPVVVP